MLVVIKNSNTLHSNTIATGILPGIIYIGVIKF